MYALLHSAQILCRVELLQWMHPEPDGRHGDLSSTASLLHAIYMDMPEPACIDLDMPLIYKHWPSLMIV